MVHNFTCQPHPFRSRDNLSVASDSVLHGAGPRGRGQQSSSSGQQSMQCLMLGLRVKMASSYLLTCIGVGEWVASIEQTVWYLDGITMVRMTNQWNGFLQEIRLREVPICDLISDHLSGFQCKRWSTFQSLIGCSSLPFFTINALKCGRVWQIPYLVVHFRRG